VAPDVTAPCDYLCWRLKYDMSAVIRWWKLIVTWRMNEIS